MTPKQKREHEKYLRALAEKAGASDEFRGPKLTVNPAKADVIVLPRESRKLTRKDKEFGTWQRKLTC